MPTKDDLDPEDPLPLFLAGEPELHDIGKPQDRARVPPRVLTGSILVAATAIGIGILSEGNPVRVFADVTASMVDKSALQPGADQSRPTIQSEAVAEDLPLAPKDAPSREDIAAAIKSAHRHQIENENGEHEALFRKFQAWTAEKDARAQIGLVRPGQDAPAAAVQDGPAEAENAGARPMKKYLQKVRSARAEIRAVRHLRQKKVRREQNAAPAQTAQTQDQSEQNTTAPSFLQMFGWRN